ncbi:uncharacterized protein LOC134220066 [Armigeres subalbatus]|uniref:uncharacterized protein LOC134220066 n=1 Tax=Armigeres subalbatus TaxID=124917 RepID=UPI002ED40FD6
MEQLREVLDGESYKLLTDNKVTDRSLMLLADSDLVTIGITAIGPRKIILAAIEKLYAIQLHSQSRSDDIEDTAHELNTERTGKQDLRAKLVEDAAFRNVVYNQLDQNIVPKVKHLHTMVQILCGQFERAIYDNKGYPTTNEQWRLAKDIIKTFPQLRHTRINENAPDESTFFWWKSGNASSDHSGYIYHRVRNIEK